MVPGDGITDRHGRRRYRGHGKLMLILGPRGLRFLHGRYDLAKFM